MKMKYWLFICHNFFIFSSIFDKLVSSLDTVMVAVFDSELGWFTVVIWLMVWWGNWGTEWKPLEEGSDLWSFVMWVNWKGKVIMDTIVESGHLTCVSIIEEVLLNLSVSSLVELVILSWSRNESGIWTIVHFVGCVTELCNMVKTFIGLSIVNKLILGKVIMPSNAIVKLTGGIVIVPLHCWVIFNEMLKFGQFEDSSLVWKSWSG